MRPLRIGVYDDGTTPLRGGAFSIKACILGQIFDLSDENTDFIRIGWSLEPTLPSNSQVVLSVPLFSLRSLAAKARWLLKPGAVIRQLMMPKKRHNIRLNAAPPPDRIKYAEYLLEKKLLEADIDLMLFLEPSEVFGPRIPFITYLWDIAHRVQPFFPELQHRQAWALSERVKGDAAARAFRLICGTETGKGEVILSYGVTHDRVAVNPFPVAKSPSTGATDPFASLSERLGLGAGHPSRYFFYPANFWAHKNHIVVIEALRILAERGIQTKVVFSGTDKGNLDYIQAMAGQLKVSSMLCFAGFVAPEELSALYTNATALLFPTLIGPDNLPPLEAMAHGCPVLASDIRGAREQLGSAALYFDPFSPESLASLMADVLARPEKTDVLQEPARQLVQARSPLHHAEKLKALCLEYRPYAHLADWRGGRGGK